MDYNAVTMGSFIKNLIKHKMLEYMCHLSLSMLFKTFLFVTIANSEWKQIFSFTNKYVY